MNYSDDLFQLIKSLTQGEKRHFKLYAQRHVIGDENNYVLVFDAIDKQTDNARYDESKVVLQIRKKIAKKHLPSVKHYLYNLILKSMRSFHADDTTTQTLRQNIADIEFLLQKGLYDKCKKLIDSCHKKALDMNRPVQLMEILILNRNLLRFTQGKEKTEGFLELEKSEEENMNSLVIEMQYRNLYDKLFLLIKEQYHLRDDKTKGFLNKIMEHPLLTDGSQAITFDSQFMFHFIHAEFSHLNGNSKNARMHWRSLTDLYERYPKMEIEEPSRYINLLNNYLSSCFQLQDFEEFPRVLQKIKNFKAISFEDQFQVFKNSTYMELLYYMNAQKFNEGLKLIPDIELGIKRFNSKLPKSRILSIYYNAAVLYFVLEKFNDSLTWLNKILFGEWEEVRYDIQNAAKILQITIHYELEHIELLESLMRSTQRHLKQNERLFAFETLLFSLIKKLIREPNTKGKKIILHEHYVKINEFIEEEKQPVIGADELGLWIKSRMENKKIFEVM